MEAAADPVLLQQQQQLHQQQQQQLQQIQDKVQHAPPLDTLVKLCVTPDQATAVIAFLDCLCSCSSFRSKLQQDSSQQQTTAAATTTAGAVAAAYQTVALTAARGRGKSAALGLAVAAAAALGVSSTFVCAPSAENVQTLFEFVQKGLVAMGLREQIDFQVSVETVGTGRRGPRGADVSGAGSSGLYERQEVKAITQIEVYRQHKQRIKFIFPHEHQTLINADLLVIDEAASIPLPIVKKLLGPYTVLLASTVNGYEGTGRSLSLKLLSDLRRGCRGPPGDGGDRGPRRQLKELSLSSPIRYAAGDAVEQWLNDLLCLDCTEAPALDPEVAIEGALSRGAIREALGRGLRPAGDLLPWTLAQAFGDEDVGLLTGARIVRIAVHPSLQRMGFGSAALQQLIDFFEGKGLSLQEPPEFAAFAQTKQKQQQQQQQQQQNGKGKKKRKERVSTLDADIEDLDAEAGASEEETEKETDEETESEGEEESEETAAKAKKHKKEKGASKKQPAASAASTAAGDGAAAELSLREKEEEEAVLLLLLLLLLPAAAAAAAAATPAEKETATRREEIRRRGLFGGIDADAETPARAADGQWVHLFAADFRRRFVQLLGGPFRRLPVSLALAIASGGPQAPEGPPDGFLPPLDAQKLLNFFTLHDLSRLHQYAQQLADLPLITDLIPELCLLYFTQRLKHLHLSFLQAATLLGLGGQRRPPDELAEEFRVPVHQILALFNKAVVKLHQHLHGLLVAEEAENFTKASTRRVAVKQGVAVGLGGPQGPLGEEQQAAAAEVLQQQALQLKKIKEALGPDAVEKYGVSHFTEEDIAGATKGREVSGEVLKCLQEETERHKYRQEETERHKYRQEETERHKYRQEETEKHKYREKGT
ncbi:LOW QUALITY PROTEIN: UPF0202 family protein, putative [Eimeria mitis]|uniref:UPF0202 family protein, putative n=1 Tax=Eimeria mitis TaxID=44415 RepID=U6KF24_9EIME|nr:LOW QUALITY PROTEIN: UPF0202 family protein, putative [Eimeria mitis]CDJ36640.1 UPF0202 family protein, putative [Eimeria mitis]